MRTVSILAACLIGGAALAGCNKTKSLTDAPMPSTGSTATPPVGSAPASDPTMPSPTASSASAP
jgi:hypothetical protein